MRFFCIILGLALAVVPAAFAQAPLWNGIAAIVNDAIITRKEVLAYTEQALQLLSRTLRDPNIFEQRANQTVADGLDQLVERQLILQDFKSSGGQLPDSIIDDEIKDRIRQRFGDRVTLTQTLKAQGMTFETYRQQTRDEIIYRYMSDRNVRAAILISPAKIERAYATNQASFQQGQQVELRMIVLNRPPAIPAAETRNLAREIKTKIEDGAKFAEMAKVYSEGSQRSEGGLWGWVEESKLNKGLAEVAFALPLDKCSPVLALAPESADAYWIYQYDPAGHVASARKYTSRDTFVEEKKFDQAANEADLPAPPKEFYLMLVQDKRHARVRPLEDVRDEIEKELIVQERARLQKKWVERLKAKSFVRYFQ